MKGFIIFLAIAVVAVPTAWIVTGLVDEYLQKKADREWDEWRKVNNVIDSLPSKDPLKAWLIKHRAAAQDPDSL